MEQVVQEHRTFTVHVGQKVLHFRERYVLSRKILEAAGAIPPESFTLEALSGPQGHAVKEFGPDDKIDLDDPERKFFRAVPNGGGRA